MMNSPRNRPTGSRSAQLGLASLLALSACQASVTDDGDDGDDALPDTIGFRAPKPQYWNLLVDQNFDGALTADWGNQGRGDDASCFSFKDGKIVIPPRTPTDCQIHGSQDFGPNGVFIFAARMKLPTTNGNRASFWLPDALGGDGYDEFRVVESLGVTEGDPNKLCATGTIRSDSGRGWYGLRNTYADLDATDGGGKGVRHCFSEAQVERLRPLDKEFHVFSMELAIGRHVKFFTDGVRTAKFGENAADETLVNVGLANLLNARDKVTGKGSSDLVVDWVKVWRKKVDKFTSEDDEPLGSRGDVCGDGACNGAETDVNCAGDCGCAAPGACETVAPFGCYCDADCTISGDCCDDDEVCHPI